MQYSNTKYDCTAYTNTQTDTAYNNTPKQLIKAQQKSRETTNNVIGKGK